MTSPHAPTLTSESTILQPICLLLLAAPLLTLGLPDAKIQADYQLRCDMSVALQRKQICWRLLRPTEDLEAMIILRLLLAISSQGLVPS